jgi:hypothetical protein
MLIERRGDTSKTRMLQLALELQDADTTLVDSSLEIIVIDLQYGGSRPCAFCCFRCALRPSCSSHKRATWQWYLSLFSSFFNPKREMLVSRSCKVPLCSRLSERGFNYVASLRRYELCNPLNNSLPSGEAACGRTCPALKLVTAHQ